MLKKKDGEEQCFEEARAKAGEYILQAEPRTENRQDEPVPEIDVALMTKKTSNNKNNSSTFATAAATNSATTSATTSTIASDDFSVQY